MPPRKKNAAAEDLAPKKNSNGAPSRDERAAAFKESFNKKMRGRAMVKAASDYDMPYMTKRRPTGLLTLDVALGGGFPCGGLSQIKGPKNSGKSWLSWQVIRQLQFYLGDDMKVLLAMTEMRADRSQARKAGVKIAFSKEDIKQMENGRKANGLPPYSKEELADLRFQIGTIDELHGVSAEELYDGVLQAIEQNVYHLIIIDSIGMVMSGQEAANESLSDKTYGGSAGVNSQFLRKLSGLLTMDDDYGVSRDTCIIGINQVRDAIGDPNKEFRTPGGRALEHAQFVDLFVASGKTLGYETQMMTPQGNKPRFIQTGKEVSWRIEKGKAGIHEGEKGAYVYDFGINTADFYNDTLVAGVHAGVIRQNGSRLGIVDPEDPKNEDKHLFVQGHGEFYINGRENFIKALIEQDRLMQHEGTPLESAMHRIRELVFKKRDINIDYAAD